MKQGKITTILVIFGALALGPAIALQHGMISRLRSNPEIYRDSLYLPAPKYVKLITLGYDNFAADFFWLRAIQTFGATYAHKENLAQLNSYFDVITDLDPQFLDAYSFGNLVMGEEAGDKVKGMSILKKGIEANPRKYRLAYEAAFYSFWTLNDAPGAQYFVRQALKCPDHPSFLSSWTGYFELKMGRYQAAYENYFRDYTKFWNAGNADLAEMRHISIRRCMDDWYTAELRGKAIEYERKHGKYPTIADLEAEGAFLEVEWPDLNLLLQVFGTFIDQNRKFPDDYNELSELINRTLHKGWTRMPDNPANYNPHFKNYLVWPGQPPLKPGGASGDMLENPLFVASEWRIAKAVNDQLDYMESFLAKYREEHGAMACPKDILDFMPDDFRKYYDPPWGGDWRWDTVECAFKIDAKPNFRNDFRAYTPF